MKIITADQRLAERRGAKILVVGPTGIGKTSLLRTLHRQSLPHPRRFLWPTPAACATPSS
jgi:ATPase subunit of ABC transporter with duplicated ATPase domains